MHLPSATTASGPLVTTDWLADHLGDPQVCLIEADVNSSAYDAGHIRGARLWNVYGQLLQPNYRIIEREAFADLLGRSGLRPGMRAVVYGYAAALAFWMMVHYGHHQVSFLDGSRPKWIGEGRPLSTEPPAITPTTYGVADLHRVCDGIRASHELVERTLDDPQHRFVDVRSLAEYSGERFWPSLPPEGNQRGGHLPGAILMPIEDTWAADGSFKPVDELRALYAARGVSPDKEIITYCAVGGRASQAWLVLRYLLGYPRVRVYDGSWIEWGTLPGVPVER